MKVKTTFMLMALLCQSVCLLGQNNTQDQSEIITNLSHEMLTKRYLKLPPNLSLEELNLPEQLNTKTILYEESIHMYMDEGADYVKESRYRSQQNLYPSWYQLPDVVYYNAKGTEQIFATKSSLFPGGWFGHNEAVTRRGIDQSEQRVQLYENTWQGHEATGRFITKLDEQESQAYVTANTNYQEKGFLPYYIPQLIQQSSADESEVENMDYGDLEYREGPGFEQLYNSDICISWYASKGLEEILFYENGELKRIVQKQFEFDNDRSMYLLNKVIEIEADLLSTGDCYERVEERYYSDYIFGRKPIEARTSEKKEVAIKLYPNPSSDALMVDLSELKLVGVDVEYQVMDNRGLTVLKRLEKGFSADKMMIDIAYLPAGSYHVMIQYSGQYVQSSFVKY